MFSSNFLTDLARKYELSPEQEEVFLLWWGNGKDDREISEQLHVTAEAIRSRKTGIYKKFSITGTGSNKANKLRNWLEAEAQKQDIKAYIQTNFVDLELQIQEVKQKITGLWKDLPLQKLNDQIQKNKSQHEKLKKLQPYSSQLDELVAETKELEQLLASKQELELLLDSLVHEVKPKIAAYVTDRCGTMRVLDMTQPVDLDRIYTDVNIIKDLTGQRRIGYDEVMGFNTREHFDRFLVGTIKERVKGFEAVEEFQKLVVLGKPGAGKTTFMKYLAMSCLGGRFHGELVPIFVTLKTYAEEREQPSLENYILTEFQKMEVSVDVVTRLLKEGRALILLDGLDEVKLVDDRRVKQDIDQFSRDWLNNRFAITCRIAAREYLFENFTEVEVSDFDDGQIATFVNNWFRERDESKAERLLERFNGNEPVKELAKSPLLLTLLCLVFNKTNNLPEKQFELFREGVDILLKIWDKKRDIERDFPKHFKGEQIYRNLSCEDKVDMIGKIAFNYFVNGEYLFRQEDLQRQIKDYICNLPKASVDPDALRLDSEVVLKAIEHHHGFLVERARNIYSFSHLTFQEYFAAREVEKERCFERLIENIFNPRWKEVFLLTAEMLRRADDFVKMMKKRIDGMLANDEKLQSFLEWAELKTNSVQFRYKTVAVRLFYAYVGIYARTQALDVNHARDRAPDLTLDLARPLAFCLDPALDLSFDLDFSFDLDLSFDLDRILFVVLAATSRIRVFAFDRVPSLDRIFTLSLAFNLDDDLEQALQVLKDKLPTNREEFYKWEKNHRAQWSNQLRHVCIDYRNIGHDWQFTKEQLELLNQYYAANLLLVECMNRSYVSKQVREGIESTMLLPSKK